MANTLKNTRVECFFYIFICIHLIVWTLTPLLVRYNLPLDAIEGTIWGQQLEWGYDKNPFLNGWLTAFAIYLGGSSGWMIYLFSQISVVACFWAVWQLAKNVLTPAYALISVLILEGVQYYNFHAIDFNDNTLELSLWALTSYFFYLALKAQTRKTSLIAWLLTGLFAALGLMAKYYTAALLAAMALFLLLYPQNRRQLATLPPYLGLGLFLLIIIPHVIWLFFHDFITIKYVFSRASSMPSWTNHFFFPAQFFWQQLQAFLPALILFALLFIGSKPRIETQKQPHSTFNKQFLFYVGLGPFLLTILLSILLGIKLRAGWGMPLLSLWGIILLAYIQPRISNIKLYNFIAGIFVLVGLQLVGYSLSLIYSSDASSANFPGQLVANTITQQWRDKYHSKLSYVAGSRWIGGNLEFYSSDHPSVFIEWDKQRAPWINTKDLQKQGAVFVWDMNDHENLPEEIQKRYPQLQTPTLLTFNWHRNNKNILPVKIGIAFLPPSAES